MADLLRDIKHGKAATVYFLYGQSHPIEELVLALRAAVLADGENDFNYDSLLAAEAGVDPGPIPVLLDLKAALAR